MPPPFPRALAGATLIGLGLLSLAPFPILGPALGWPASLDDPASAMLPRLAANLEAAQTGYGLYLLYSVLFVVPVAVLVSLGNRVLGTLGTVAIAFAALSVAARSLGILRWLTTMPDLAARMDGADAATTSAISLQYESMNSAFGAVGEVLGVGLFAGCALAAAAWAGWGSGRLPRWVLIATVAVAVVQISSIGGLLGIPGASVMVTSTAFNLWLLTIGAWLVVSRGDRHPEAPTPVSP